MGALSRRLLSLSTDQVRFDRRGFRGGNAAVRARIEQVGLSFLAGYHAALAESDCVALCRELDRAESDFRGFAYEGAAMSLFLVDRLAPWRGQKFEVFCRGGGDAHLYMAQVGAGWALARLPMGLERGVARLDPLLRWLAYDGYGFHQGFFDWRHSVCGPRRIPRRVRGYGRRAFDQGLGRSLWFVEGAEVRQIPVTIGGFPLSRHSDLWSGVGLAATYAGGVGREDLEHLRIAAGGFSAELAQGSAFAAEARLRAGNVTAHTEMASRVFCALNVGEAAAVTEETRRGLPPDRPDLPAFEVWRQRIQQRFSPSVAVPLAFPATA